jgi:ppGpp synthetase/RelA/SpoT-type nucleotidyltranferase
VITSAQTKSKYVSLEGYLEFVRARVRDTLLGYCDGRNYAFVSRIKSLQSLSEKIESGRYGKWSEIEDLLACAVVIPTLFDEDSVLSFLASAFEQVDLKKRGSARKAPDTFRFDLTRFIGRLRRPEGFVGDEPVFQVTFEIQIRSAFEHAWSVTTHALTYKGEAVSWNRLRLTAQLKAAAEQLDMLIIGFEEAAKKIPPSLWPEVQAKTEITDFFKQQFDGNKLPVELSPKDWSRFGDNVFAMVRSSPWSKGKRPKDIADAIAKQMEVEINSLGRDRIPMSISLLQFVFGALCKAGIVTAPLDRFCPLITLELEALYPVNAFEFRFDFTA